VNARAQPAAGLARLTRLRGSATVARRMEARLTVDPVIRVLSEYLAGKSRSRLVAAQINPDANVWTAGYVDSLGYVEFLVFIEERYGVTISDVDIVGDLNTLRALAGSICAQSPREASP
jgi:acyl carrier protein